jgi:hypothetical protein
MSEHLEVHGRHCPFLNRAESRCARHFSLDQLQHTFDHCFGQYETCGVYLELLYERRVKRAAARLQQHLILGTGVAGEDKDHANTDPDHEQTPLRRPAGAPIVQLTIAGRAPLGRRFDQGSADPALVSHASGV